MQNTELAVTVGLLSHFLNVLGMVLMKKVHLAYGFNANTGVELTMLLCNGTWLCGLFVMATGAVLYVLSLGWGPITLVTALHISAIPFNILLSYLILTKKQGCTAEASATYSTAKTGNPNEELPHIKDSDIPKPVTVHLDSPSCTVYVCSALLCIALGSAIAYAPAHGEWDVSDDLDMWGKSNPAFLLWTFGLIALVVGIWLIRYCTCEILDHVGTTKYNYKVAMFMIYKGICSAYVAILGKLTYASLEAEDWDRFRVYVAFFVVLSVFPLEYPLRQTCLASTDMTKALPTMVVSVMVFSVPTGGLFFGEFDDLESEHTAFFVSLLAAGVIALIMNGCDSISQSIASVLPHQAYHGLAKQPKGTRNFHIPGILGADKCLPSSKRYDRVQDAVEELELEEALASQHVIADDDEPYDEPPSDTSKDDAEMKRVQVESADDTQFNEDNDSALDEKADEHAPIIK